jgi:hypothetical protein
MKKYVLASVAALLLGTGACSHSAGQAGYPAEPVLPNPVPSVDVSTHALPFDSYAPADQQALVLTEARNTLAARCLARFGFTVKPPKPELSFNPKERRYLLDDEARAAQYGYKVPEITNRQREPEPALSAEGEAVMTGRGASVVGGQSVPEGGCIGESYRILGIDRSPNSGAQFVSRKRVEIHERMMQDSRVVAAIKAWSACMAESGYSYPDPSHANNDPVFATQTATAQEIATAVADVRCKHKVNLTPLQVAVEGALQQQAIDQNAEMLQTYRKQLDEQVAKAANVIAGTS